MEMNSIIYLIALLACVIFFITYSIKGKNKNKDDNPYSFKEKNESDEIDTLYMHNVKKAVIKDLFTKEDIKTMALDTEELKRVLSSNDVKAIDSYLLSVDIIFNGYPKNITNIKEYIEILIDYAFKIADVDVLINLLEVISHSAMYAKKNEVSYDSFEENIGNVLPPILQQYICVLHSTYNVKYLDTILMFENHSDPEVREYVKDAKEELEFLKQKKYSRFDIIRKQ